jgi:beta-barrel assembly-enhancing protease
MRSEAELAGVLAHEIAHVERKHHLEALQRSLRDQSLSEMRQYFTVTTGNSIADQFSTALLNAGKDLYIKGLDPSAEYESDRIGVVIAARSGYSAYGLGGVLQTLTATTDEKAYGMHTRTHPLPLDRLKRLDAAMGIKFEAMPGLVEDSPGYLALRRPTLAPAPPPKPAKKKRSQ